ncbi:MAG TPA: hypothetical protein VMN81_06465 [Vicinamibacterales bacterium]|nr:hypothetical protein [Vicinamibacterales bacterium]
MTRAISVMAAATALVAGLALAPHSHVHRSADAGALRHAHLDAHAAAHASGSRHHHHDGASHAHYTPPHDHDEGPLLSAAGDFVFPAASGESRRVPLALACSTLLAAPERTAEVEQSWQPPAHGPPDVTLLPARAPPVLPAAAA